MYAYKQKYYEFMKLCYKSIIYIIFYVYIAINLAMFLYFKDKDHYIVVLYHPSGGIWVTLATVNEASIVVNAMHVHNIL